MLPKNVATGGSRELPGAMHHTWFRFVDSPDQIELRSAESFPGAARSHRSRPDQRCDEIRQVNGIRTKAAPLQALSPKHASSSPIPLVEDSLPDIASQSPDERRSREDDDEYD
jgi:hypothetical protein